MLTLLLTHALAAPIPIQGSLYDATGAPAQGSIAATLHIYDTPTGAALHDVPTTLDAHAGAFSTSIDGDLLAPSLRAGDDLWIGVTWGGQTAARVPVGAAPRALWADAAGELIGDLPWSQVTGAPTRVATGYTGSGPITVDNTSASLGFNLSAISADIATIAEGAVAGDYVPSTGPATLAGALTVNSLSTAGAVSSTSLVSSPALDIGPSRTVNGRWVGTATPPTWITMARLTISAPWGMSSLTGDLFIGDDTELWRRCSLSIHARSQEALTTDRPHVRWLSDCVGNTNLAASGTGAADGGVRVVKVADTNGGAKVYEVQVSPINDWPVVTWSMRHAANNSTYAWEVFATEQAASAALSSTNTVHGGITRNSQRPYIKLTNSSGTLSNGQTVANGGGNAFVTTFTPVETRGRISADTNGITIEEPGLYLVGYTMSVMPNAGGHHGWLNVDGARVASWYSTVGEYIAGSAPVMLNAGSRVRLEVHNGAVFIDGNPRSIYAIKID